MFLARKSFIRVMSTTASSRTSDLQLSLSEIKSRVEQLSSDRSPTLVAVSKYKAASDIQACYDVGQRDFGENYVQELVEKAEQLPKDIRWHFIGTLQSNKAKTVAGISNLHTVQTVSSIKLAAALDKYWPDDRQSRLNVLLQVNTSGEDSKSGLSASSVDGGLLELAKHVVTSCPRLYLQGLMTIGSLSESLSAADENRDFEALKQTRDALQDALSSANLEGWGQDGKLLLSMGMSSDFEAALRAGSDVVRVGTGIFGERHKKGE